MAHDVGREARITRTPFCHFLAPRTTREEHCRGGGTRHAASPGPSAGFCSAKDSFTMAKARFNCRNTPARRGSRQRDHSSVALTWCDWPIGRGRLGR